MSEQSDLRPDDPSTSGARRSVPFRVLVVLLAAEALLVWLLLAWQVYALVTSEPTALSSAIALIVLNAIAAVWVSAIALNAWRRRGWTRGAGVTWQLVQIAVAIGAFQGVYARPDIGWALLIPSIVVLVLLLAPGVLTPIRDSEPPATNA